MGYARPLSFYFRLFSKLQQKGVTLECVRLTFLSLPMGPSFSSLLHNAATLIYSSWDSNWGPLKQEATALPTEPPPLPSLANYLTPTDWSWSSPSWTCAWWRWTARRRDKKRWNFRPKSWTSRRVASFVAEIRAKGSWKGFSRIRAGTGLGPSPKTQALCWARS